MAVLAYQFAMIEKNVCFHPLIELTLSFFFDMRNCTGVHLYFKTHDSDECQVILAKV